MWLLKYNKKSIKLDNYTIFSLILLSSTSLKPIKVESCVRDQIFSSDIHFCFFEARSDISKIKVGHSNKIDKNLSNWDSQFCILLVRAICKRNVYKFKKNWTKDVI